MEIIQVSMSEKLNIDPIGTLHSELVHRYETPRQGILAGSRIAEIHLNPHRNYEQAVKDLEGFERLWIIYWFHKSLSWKPLVNPPRQLGTKVGVFATRSPFRPNQIGLSCVKLERVEGLRIIISESDILDGSPILDIKPYLPYSDSFPSAATGWVKSRTEEIFEVEFDTEAQNLADQIKESRGVNLFNYASVQLQFDPKNISRKRISTEDNILYKLDYQKWQMIYLVDETQRKVFVKSIAVK